ncbi:MAG: choice-of-anchor A family protein, partial [Fimbriimonadales bacterium]|nr:choice-of-anchor A family protein [Fimbriimonadales bacterium]
MSNRLLLRMSGLALAVMYGSAFANPLGTVAQFNLVSFGDMTAQNSDVEGKVAVGGNANLQNYSIAFKDQGGDAFQVGGNVTFTNGTIYGNLRHAGTASLTNVNFSAGGSAIQGPTPFDFAAAYTFLRQHSTFWAGLTPNGTVTNFFGELRLQGSSNSLNIFNINANDLVGINGVNILVPNGSTALINVSGSSVNFPNIGYNYNSSQNNALFQKVLWNLHQANSMSVNSLRGSVLAVDAALNGSFGAIEGQVFVGSFSGPTQVNLWRF